MIADRIRNLFPWPLGRGRTSFSRQWLRSRYRRVSIHTAAIAPLLALSACSTPAIKDRVVEVSVPIATHPVAAADVPVVPAPLPKRPANVSAALDVALAGYCQMVAYALKADPLLRVSAGLPPKELAKYPMCEGR